MRNNCSTVSLSTWKGAVSNLYLLQRARSFSILLLIVACCLWVVPAVQNAKLCPVGWKREHWNLFLVSVNIGQVSSNYSMTVPLGEKLDDIAPIYTQIPYVTLHSTFLNTLLTGPLVINHSLNIKTQPLWNKMKQAKCFTTWAYISCDNHATKLVNDENVQLWRRLTELLLKDL